MKKEQESGWKPKENILTSIQNPIPFNIPQKDYREKKLYIQIYALKNNSVKATHISDHLQRGNKQSPEN